MLSIALKSPVYVSGILNITSKDTVVNLPRTGPARMHYISKKLKHPVLMMVIHILAP
jgi:hypothetical protein